MLPLLPYRLIFCLFCHEVTIFPFRGKILAHFFATKSKFLVSWQNFSLNFCHEIYFLRFVAEIWMLRKIILFLGRRFQANNTKPIPQQL